MLVVHQR